MGSKKRDKQRHKGDSRKGMETMTAPSNDEIIVMIQEKMKEKNEIIKEQQMQIQELQAKLEELENKVVDLEGQSKQAQEDLYERLSQVLE